MLLLLRQDIFLTITKDRHDFNVEMLIVLPLFGLFVV